HIVGAAARRRPVPGAEILCALDEAIGLARPPEPAFVIGGEARYREAQPRADLLYLTEILRDFDGDARFPAFDRSQWREISRTEHRALDDAGGFAYHFAAYERLGPHSPATWHR